MLRYAASIAAMTNTRTHKVTASTTPRMALVVGAIVAIVSIVLGIPALASTPAPPIPAPPAYVVAEAITDAPDGWVAVEVGDPRLEELRVVLLEAGYHGDPTDGTDDVIYAPQWAVLDVPGGTWTITPEGGARCVDWATTGAECADGVYLPWSLDYIAS